MKSHFVIRFVMMIFYGLLTFSYFGRTLAQIPSLASCPEVETVPDFDVSRYLGRWYEAQRYFAFFELGAKCVTADYTRGENGTVTVVNSQISSITGNPSSIDGVARVPNSSEPAKLKVKFSSVPFGIEGDYWVLGTDYESYSVVYSCANLHFANFKLAWILTREQNPTKSVIDKALEIVMKNKIDVLDFSMTGQTDCAVNP